MTGRVNIMTNFEHPAERIMVALDVDELAEAQAVIDDLHGLPVAYKVGNQLGTFEGWPEPIKLIHASGARVFCDTKFKDIPETVGKSARSITRHQPDFFNIMADNGRDALVQAVQGRDRAISEFGLLLKPILLGVTVLTSIDNDECISIYGAGSAEKVLQFAGAAALAGLDGVVCSAQEAALLRANEGTSKLLLVTPGIRPDWAVAGDQSRVLSPREALSAGADYLVIGRPITNPPEEVGSPRAAVERILEEIG
jgi:orotidine-5'-phosphate decarboxylase